ncbi:MAG: glycosyltransferase family 39 protein [Candidatus Korarchaeum sp.]
MSKSFSLGLLISILISLSFSLYTYGEASSPKYRGDSYYVSDEVWYVTSSRNLLHEVFGLRPIYSSQGYQYVTLVFKSERELREYFEWLNETLLSLGGSIERSNYTLTGDGIPILWVGVPESRVAELERMVFGRAELRYGFEYPSKAGITDYLNLEHPPLGKYLIMLSMLALGDEPTSWRVPGILEGSLLIVIVYLVVCRLLNPFWGVLASISLALDPIIQAMSIVAMLDIHLAFFTGLTLLLVVYDRPLAASITSWLAFSVKFSGLFALLFTYLYLRIYRREGLSKSALLCLAPGSLYLLISLPLINHLGFERWVHENLSAFVWHTTSRGSGPTPSPPWAWFLNLAPMMLHISPDLMARVNLVSYSLAGTFSLLLFPLLVRRERSYLPMMMILSIIAGYTLVYIAGNRTLYSFYAVQLAPSVASSFSISLFYLIMMDEELSSFIASNWRGVLRAILQGGLELPDELKPLKILLSGGYRTYYILSMVFSTFLSLLMHSSLSIPGTPVFMAGEQGFGLSSLLSDLLIRSSDSLVLREILFGSIALISILLVSLDLLELRVDPHPLTISLVLLSGYDWSLLSLSLALESVLAVRRGRRYLSAILLAISSSLNPLSLFLFPLALERSKKSFLIFLGTLIPLTLSGPTWPREAVGGVLNPLAGTYAPLIALATSLLLTWYLMRFDRFWSSIIGIGSMVLLSGSKPSWGLIGVALLSGSPISPLIELLLSLSLITYANPSLLSSPLFKCRATSPNESCSDPFIAVTVASLILLYLGARGISRKLFRNIG